MSQHCWENGKKCPKLQDFSGAKMSMIWNLNFNLMYLPGILEASTFRNKSPFYGGSRKTLRFFQLKNPLDKEAFWSTQFSQQMFWCSIVVALQHRVDWYLFEKYRTFASVLKRDLFGQFFERCLKVFFATKFNDNAFLCLVGKIQLLWNPKTFAEKTEKPRNPTFPVDFSTENVSSVFLNLHKKGFCSWK